jgi:hypothetical protein
MHDEVSGIRKSLLAEGRARRASTTAVAGSSGSPANQAAAMIARRLSNTTIYPAAYDAAAALGSCVVSAGVAANSYNSGYDGLQQSWEAANLASLSKDEQGRVKVGYYGNMADVAPGSAGSTLNVMPPAGTGLAGGFAGNQPGWLPGKARAGGGGGDGGPNGGSGSRRSSGSSSSRSSSDGSEGTSDSSSDDDDDAANVYGWNPAAAARQKPRVSSKRGGWRVNERAAAKARASISSSNGGAATFGRDSRISGGVGRSNSMNGRSSRRSLLQQPHTTRAVSKPERQATAGLAKAAAARRSSIGVSRQSLKAAGRGVDSRGYDAGQDGSSGSSSRRSSGSSSDAKTDIFELMVRHRSSITTGKGFLGEQAEGFAPCDFYTNTVICVLQLLQHGCCGYPWYQWF